MNELLLTMFIYLYGTCGQIAAQDMMYLTDVYDEQTATMIQEVCDFERQTK